MGARAEEAAEVDVEGESEEEFEEMQPKTWDMWCNTKYIIGTESSVSMDYVLILELNHKIMSLLW